MHKLKIKLTIKDVCIILNIESFPILNILHAELHKCCASKVLGIICHMYGLGLNRDLPLLSLYIGI